MRISDWSSDVCSSDLRTPRRSEAAAEIGSPFLIKAVGNALSAHTVPGQASAVSLHCHPGQATVGSASRDLWLGQAPGGSIGPGSRSLTLAWPGCRPVWATGMCESHRDRQSGV